MRINVVGTSGSGKSTLSKQLSEQYCLPYISLDQLFWKPDWEHSGDQELLTKVKNALDTHRCWVIDGNYTRTIPLKWAAVDVVIWLDYSFPRVLYQALTRALYNSWHKQELWPGTNNRESFKKLFSRDSIVLWTLKTYSRTRKKYQAHIQNTRYQHIRFIRITSPKQAKKQLAILSQLAQ